MCGTGDRQRVSTKKEIQRKLVIKIIKENKREKVHWERRRRRKINKGKKEIRQKKLDQFFFLD